MLTEQRKLRKLDDEKWKIVPDTNERYHVSNYGRMKSFAYNKKEGSILNCFVINGFKQVQITTNKGARKYYLHKLIAENWIPKPSDKHDIVTHLDGNINNNQISNLEWHTKESIVVVHREITKQNMNKPTFSRVIKNSKLKEQDVKLLKSMLERGVVQSKIAKMFCISEMQVTRIKRGENWGHVKATPIEKKN